MNYCEKNQIMKLLNHLNPDYSTLKKGNDIDDPLFYLNEKKKLIKFVNCKLQLFNVKIPVSITKKDLYSIIHYFYQYLNYGNSILLVYMNCILNCDESPTDCISDGDMIIIIEPSYYNDDSYLDSLTDINKKGDKINVELRDGEKLVRFLVVPINTTYEQLYKALILKYGNNIYFIGNEILKPHNNKILNNFERFTMKEWGSEGKSYQAKIIGKKINIKLIEKSGNKSKVINEIPIGILTSVKEIINWYKIYKAKKILKVFINNKEINLQDNTSVKSLGIITDSECIFVVEKNMYN